jgi:hypothetical protein
MMSLRLGACARDQASEDPANKRLLAGEIKIKTSRVFVRAAAERWIKSMPRSQFTSPAVDVTHQEAAHQDAIKSLQ